jgi:glutamate-5-semialdehyde dehydrogenase
MSLLSERDLPETAAALGSAPVAPAEAVREVAEKAKAAAVALAAASRSVKDAALLAMAEALSAACAELLAANELDVQRAAANGTSIAMIDRLTLTEARIAAMAAGLRQVASLPDPVGEVVRGSTLANGLEVRQLRVPFGVIGIVYEARPNVTVDAAGLCLKSGNAVLLRGSASAYQSNIALVGVLRTAAQSVGLPADIVNLVPGVDHESVRVLLRLRGLVDLVIPRGGAGLIRTVVEEATVPVIETGVGNCHIYVDEDADLEMAINIMVNAKTQRPSVCNSAETVLIHRAVAPDFLALALPALRTAGVTVHGDPAVQAYDPAVVPAHDVDWADEYLSLDIAVRIVDSLQQGLEHIRAWSSGHTEAIITRSLEASRRFIAGCDSAAVMVNASTRFTDGEQLGMGAEIGISTQKMHARGPMGLTEMTSTKWVITGNGQIRE